MLRSVEMYEIVWSYHRKMLLKCAVPFFFFNVWCHSPLTTFVLFWIVTEMDWGKMKQSPRHTCCIRSLKSIEENVCRGLLTAKTNQKHQSIIYSPLLPFSASENRNCFLKNTFQSVVMGFQKFMGFPDCNPRKSHPRRKRKEWNPKVITGYRKPGGCTGDETEAPDIFREPRRQIPSTWEEQGLNQVTLCALRMLLCSCKQVEGHAQERGL